jgi:DNA-binding IclR family transcriptional regulator
MNAVETSAREWLDIIRGEFQEVPGLNLTKAQVCRRWALDGPTCDRVLNTLVQEQFLKQTASGSYVRLNPAP